MGWLLKIFGGLNPAVWAYAALALIAWTGGVYWYADSHGYARADSSWVIKSDALTIKAAAVKAASDDRVKGLEQDNRDLNAKLEKEHADSVAKIAADHDAAIAQLNAGGVLIDKNGHGYCRTNSVPSDRGAVVHSEPAAVLGCELSATTSRKLTDDARDADLNTDFANKCRTWALTVPMLCKN